METPVSSSALAAENSASSSHTRQHVEQRSVQVGAVGGRVGPARRVLAVPIAALVPSSTTPEAGTSVASTSITANPLLCSDGAKIPAPDVPKIPKTTQWRHKHMGTQSGQRKVYSCRVCLQPTTMGGHAQYYGHRYCPHSPGQIPREEWLAIKRQERAAARVDTASRGNS